MPSIIQLTFLEVIVTLFLDIFQRFKGKFIYLIFVSLSILEHNFHSEYKIQMSNNNSSYTQKTWTSTPSEYKVIVPFLQWRTSLQVQISLHLIVVIIMLHLGMKFRGKEIRLQDHKYSKVTTYERLSTNTYRIPSSWHWSLSSVPVCVCTFSFKYIIKHSMNMCYYLALYLMSQYMNIKNLLVYI